MLKTLNRCQNMNTSSLTSNYVHSLMDAAIEMASEIAEKSPVAVQGTKVNLNYARDHSVQDALEFVVSSVKIT